MDQRPQWMLLPFNNNRTAWKPVQFPAIFMIPFGAGPDGQPLSQSAPTHISISILDVIRRNRVTGHQNLDKFFPNRELFTITLQPLEITKRQIDTNDFIINDNKLTIISRTGVTGTIPYVPNALYYDLSDIAIEVENLAHGRYQLSYSASLYRRIYDSAGGLVCIDDTKTDIIRENLIFNHPGEVMAEMVKSSPSVWFTNEPLETEPLITLYKPLTDSLQNVYDEQILLSQLNFVNQAYPETIPLLGQLIGWEIPYFPHSLDPLRQAVLRTTTELQKIRGSFVAIHQLFSLFGFTILLRNLWWNETNTELISPSYSPTSPLRVLDSTRIDIGLSDIRAPGFLNQKIPLTKKPSIKTEFDDFVDSGSNIAVEAFVVEVNSDAHQIIETHKNSLSAITTTTGSFVNSLSNELSNVQIYASQQLYYDHVDRTTKEIYRTGKRAVLTNNLKIDFYEPSVEIQLSGHWGDENLAIYIFVMYNHQESIVANDNLNEKRSNYFDIRLVSRDDSLFPTNLVLDHAIEFMQRIKAFHSLIRRIFITVELCETYLVTDQCYGNNLSRPFDSDIGMQQVPPAIIPEEIDSEDCVTQNVRTLGYKESDIAYRDKTTDGLVEEWNAYNNYDSRSHEPNATLNFAPQIPNTTRNNGFYSEFGQDAYTTAAVNSIAFGLVVPFQYANQPSGLPLIHLWDSDLNTQAANRSLKDQNKSIIEFLGSYTPADSLEILEPTCFKGRVRDALAINTNTPLKEQYEIVGCGAKMGTGALFTTPRISTIVRGGAANRSLNSKSSKPIISSGASKSGELFDNFWVYPQNSVGCGPKRISGNSNEVLHHWNKSETIDPTWNSAAVESPNLGISKTDMHFPGTRFINMSKFDGDFISSTHDARPWDFDVCENELDSSLSTNLESLVFKQQPFMFSNNTGAPDIPEMGSPDVSSISPSEMIHAIFSRFEENQYYPSDGTIKTILGDLLDTDDPTIKLKTKDVVFKTANNCDFTKFGGDGFEIIDFIEGYGCITGIQIIDVDVGSDYDISPSSVVSIRTQFTLSSGIKNDSFGLRLNCDCSMASCPLLLCNTPVSFGGGESYPHVETLFIGEGVGVVTLNYQAFAAPDKFVIEFDGQQVINTGYRGISQQSEVLEEELIRRGEPTEEIVGTGLGTATFIKTTTTSTATIRIYAPLENTAWTFSLDCPEEVRSTPDYETCKALDADAFETESRLALSEKIGICGDILDGRIPSMFELLDN